MANDTYNGWANRETWALNLWLSNDQGIYLATMEIAEAAREEHDSARYVGERIMLWVTDELPELMDANDYASMRNDIGSLWRVDGREIGEAWMEDA